MENMKLFVRVSEHPGQEAVDYSESEARSGVSPNKQPLNGFCVDRGLRSALESLNSVTPVFGETGKQVSVTLGKPMGSSAEGYDLFAPESVFLAMGTEHFSSLEDVNRYFAKSLKEDLHLEFRP
ncbi:MAG TPA: hypothetical protein VLH08_18590 [Acidobacteriota bacterium]|nr:hypothetical protein [Acidobacteriota bacterium]